MFSGRLDREMKEEEDSILGPDLIISFRRSIRSYKRNNIYLFLWVCALFIGACVCAYLKSIYGSAFFFILAVGFAYFGVRYNLKEIIEAGDELIDFTEKQEIEIESSLGP